MTRKDYKLIANAMLRAKPREDANPRAYDAWVDCCESLSQALASDNNRFCKTTFLDACGVENDNCKVG